MSDEHYAAEFEVDQFAEHQASARIPDNILEELKKYRDGLHPYSFGGFMTAVLANDLVGAIQQADGANIHRLPLFASFLYNEMPGIVGDPTIDMWGSYPAVRNTIARQYNTKMFG